MGDELEFVLMVMIKIKMCGFVFVMEVLKWMDVMCKVVVLFDDNSV